MASEPAALSDSSAEPAATSSSAVDDLAAALAATGDELATMPNPFGKPTCDLVSLLNGTAPGSLSSFGSKSSAGEAHMEVCMAVCAPQIRGTCS
jgi:hypothetical protein